MTCCMPIGDYSELPTVGECELCGGGVDINGKQTEPSCEYSIESNCESCGYAPCDESC